MKKRLLATLLVSAMALTLAACGGKPSTPPAGGNGSSGSPTPAPSGDKIAINVIAA
ncbi:MAG: protein disulfide oxidoreductase, partial [Lawsonibacter sp.]|nr:protein disulfide oxidoreductase [Lawsonibacter sp.]